MVQMTRRKTAVTCGELAHDVLREIPDLLPKVMKSTGESSVRCRGLIEEVIRFLTLVAMHEARLTPSMKVDLAWHEFILFTKTYASVCERNFGRFIHHNPSDDKAENKAGFRRTLDLYKRSFGPVPREFWGVDPTVECGNCGNR